MHYSSLKNDLNITVNRAKTQDKCQKLDSGWWRSYASLWMILELLPLLFFPNLLTILLAKFIGQVTKGRQNTRAHFLDISEHIAEHDCHHY